MLLAFKYRLYPTEEQAKAFAATLETHRRLYNRALCERKQAYETQGRCLRYGDQSAWLKTERAQNPSLAATNFSSTQATLRRLDRAFAAFFRRIKSGEKPGYPRFRGFGRFDSVEFPAYGDGCKLDGAHVYFQHIGRVKVKLHRPVEGTIKTVRFKREADGWHVVFCCELPDPTPEPSQAPAVGIDLGLKSFLVTSDGESVRPPKFYASAQKSLAKASRALSRCQKASKRRRKAVQRVARQHQRVANQRKDWQHKLALSLVQRYGTIAHEDLNIKGIARSRLAKSTLDAGWAQFLAILRHKAACAGVRIEAVCPKHTTQRCSRCGCLPATPLTLRDRVYACAFCGHISDRDLNAAVNILQRSAWTEPSVVNVSQ